MLKYLPGIILIQLATAAMIYTVFKTGDRELWLAIGLLAILITLITGFWFASLARQSRNDALAKAQEKFSKERELLKVSVEKQKTKIIKDGHKQILKQTHRTQAKASFKLGAAFVGIIGIGSLLLFSQLLTLGLLTISTGGGALLGYMAKTRQYNLLQQKNAAQDYIEHK
ncbi:MAG: hypothetical protein V3W04_10005 [Gammaproteobacteria bacterium]